MIKKRYKLSRCPAKRFSCVIRMEMVAKFVLIIWAILGVALSQFPDVPDSDIRKISPINDGTYRLPGDTVPNHYDITLEPNFQEFTFDGTVIITIQVVENTNIITLHKNDLTINTIEVRMLGASALLPVGSTSEEPDLHFFRIHLESTVQSGDILEVTLFYTGNLNTENRGFYRASYFEDGNIKWFGTTHFAATEARRAFPCYDEPALKAIFTIHIIRPATYNSVSNTDPAGAPVPVDGKFRDDFQDTVLMSTYLVAFVVSEMTSTGRLNNQAVIAAPALINDGRGDYGRQTGIDTLQAMAEFTGIPYSLSKLDQVGLPDPWFTSGAMENWGLVTYRERYILWKSEISTSSEKQNVASVIAHELGHQWFGNLVSPLWWTYLWLNEGFATYFEHYATNIVEPGMRMMDQYVTAVNQRAMDNDATTITRPMSYYAETPTAIRALFDRIAYQKSGAVIRMMEHFLTPEIFRAGLNNYLTNRQYSTGEAQDLWDGLQSAVDQINADILGERTVEEIMENWHTAAGFPVISVSRNANGMIVLAQERFFLDSTTTNEANTIWTVPINYVTNTTAVNFANTQATHWLDSAEATTDIELADGDWIILNKQAIGYYRVNYEDENWRLIIDYLNTTSYGNIHLANRAQLINDAFNLARSKKISFSLMFDLFTYLHRETDYVPLYSFFNALDYLNRLLINSDEHYEILQRFVNDLLQTAFMSVTSDITQAHTVRLNQVNVYNWLCRLGHANCLLLMHGLLSARAIAYPDIQTPVYCGGLITDQNTESNWMYVFDRYRGDEAEALEKSRLLSALGCTTSNTHLRRWLDIIFGNDEEFSIDVGEVTAAFAGIVSAHKFGLDTAFDYVLNNFQQINTHLSVENVAAILNSLSSRLTTTAQQAELQGLFDSLNTGLQTTHQQGFNTAFANIENNIKEAELHLPAITQWLDEYNSGFVFGISLPLLLAALFIQLFT